MILYDPGLPLALTDFGIQIPVRDSRAGKTFQALVDHPAIGPMRDRWHLLRSDDSLTREDLLRVHSQAYVDRLFSDGLEDAIIRTYELIDETGKYHRYDPETAVLPLGKLLDRILERASGTVQCCRAAITEGFCFYFGGGMHHAHRDFGHGFCLINDIVIAVRKLQAEGIVETAWIIDVDAHKGDGTAALTTGDPSVVALSVHMAEGWPLDGPEFDADGRQHPSFIPSDIDIPVAAGEEDRYVPRLEKGLAALDAFPRPDLAVVVCGSDPYEHDELPSTTDLRLTLDGLMDRDRLIHGFLKDRSIAMAWLMAGGYGERSWEVYTQFLTWAMATR